MTLERLLILPDCHFPYVDRRAWNLMLKVARDFDPDHIVTMGDFADFYSVSSHSKDPERINKLGYEVKSANAALDELDALGKGRRRKIKKTFIAGNHEDRLERYLMEKAPELFDVVKIPELFELSRRGWVYVPYKSSVKVGRVNFTHDTGKAGPTAHSSALDDFQDNAVIGHTHRLSYVVKGNAKGDAHVGAMFGWLGDEKKADYMHRIKANRDWAKGFGIGYIDPKTQCTYLTPVPIVKYTCVVEGTLYKG